MDWVTNNKGKRTTPLRYNRRASAEMSLAGAAAMPGLVAAILAKFRAEYRF